MPGDDRASASGGRRWALGGSVLLGWAGGVSWASLLVNSSLLAAVGSVRATIGSVWTTSRLAALLARATTALRRSWLHGWLTTDPDPDEVVIDLRETRSLGPLVAVTDRVAPPLRQAAGRARLVRAAIRPKRAFSRAPLRVASAVLLLVLAGELLLAMATAAVSLPAFGRRVTLVVLALLGTRITHDWTALASRWTTTREE